MTNHDKPWQTMTNHEKPWQAMTNPSGDLISIFGLEFLRSKRLGPGHCERTWCSGHHGHRHLVALWWSPSVWTCVNMLTVSSKCPLQHEENLFRVCFMKLFRTWRFCVFVMFCPWKCYPPRPEDQEGSWEIAARIPLYAALRSSECLDLQKTLRLAGSPPLSNCHNCHAGRLWVGSFPFSCLDPCGYGSIPINTIFRGMNIHKSQLFWCELQGTKVLTHTHVCLKCSLNVFDFESRNARSERFAAMFAAEKKPFAACQIHGLAFLTLSIMIFVELGARQGPDQLDQLCAWILNIS